MALLRREVVKHRIIKLGWCVVREIRQKKGTTCASTDCARVCDRLIKTAFQGVVREVWRKKRLQKEKKRVIEAWGHLRRSPENRSLGKLEHIYCIYIYIYFWCMIILIGCSWFSSFLTPLHSSHLINRTEHWYEEAGPFCHSSCLSVCITELVNHTF